MRQMPSVAGGLLRNIHMMLMQALGWPVCWRAQRERLERVRAFLSVVPVVMLLAGCLLVALSALPATAQQRPSPAPAATAPVVRIGVLAYRGDTHARQRWQPLIACLQRQVPQYRFELVQMTLNSAADLLARGDVSFIITNPGHFVMLRQRFPLSALATLVRHTPDGRAVMHFGSVIFTRAASDIRDMAAARGRVVAAVSRDAFGGFLVGWREFRRLGLDLLDDDVRMYFTGFPQDNIVATVLDGRADVGIVRTGLLESMVREGRLRLQDVRVLNPVPQAGFPWLVSSRLYPEWPFVVRDGVSRELAGLVAAALLEMEEEQVRRRCGLEFGWAAPLSYGEVERLLHEFEQAREQRNATRDWLLWVALLAVAVAAFAAAWLWRQRQAEELKVQARVASGGISLAERARFDELTRRELQVLACLCEGLSSKEIAQRLGIAPKTVEYHRTNLLKKTGFSSTTKMVSVAARLGLDTCPGKTREKTGEAPGGDS